jgi:hypothetical protein
MVAALAAGLVAALSAGDTDAARVANATIAALLGTPGSATPGGSS